MPGKKGASGGSRPAVRADDARGGARIGSGTPPRKATTYAGGHVVVTHAYAGGVAHLGSGVAEIEKSGADRLIKVVQADGSEIRILILDRNVRAWEGEIL